MTKAKEEATTLTKDQFFRHLDSLTVLELADYIKEFDNPLWHQRGGPPCRWRPGAAAAARPRRRSEDRVTVVLKGRRRQSRSNVIKSSARITNLGSRRPRTWWIPPQRGQREGEQGRGEAIRRSLKRWATVDYAVSRLPESPPLRSGMMKRFLPESEMSKESEALNHRVERTDFSKIDAIPDADLAWRSKTQSYAEFLQMDLLPRNGRTRACSPPSRMSSPSPTSRDHGARFHQLLDRELGVQVRRLKGVENSRPGASPATLF